ncbi:hypothetical protein [Caldimonas tepidiphila]|uniref:hypothetical protein n=1 Tax=Caldimonas tepidiphila TaxID=2315841 RepID=UPI0013003BAD|nr:hypothetical protein [Caldimonas tepidiphila]
MSLLSPDHVRVGLSPREVVIVRRGGGWRRAPAERRTLPCPRPPQRAPWQAALPLLAEALDAGGSGPARLSIVLSNHFVRYAVLPWNEAFTRPAEREALARHRFAEVYGEAASGWRISLSECHWGAGALACAVDEALAEQLVALCAERRLALLEVQPYFMQAFNRFRRRLGRSGCFCLAEPGRVCLGVFRKGAWETLHSQRLPADAGPAGFGTLLARLLGATGVAPGMPVFVCGADGLPDAPDDRAALPPADTANGAPLAGLPPLRLLRRASGRAADEAIALWGAA